MPSIKFLNIGDGYVNIETEMAISARGENAGKLVKVITSIAGEVSRKIDKSDENQKIEALDISFNLQVTDGGNYMITQGDKPGNFRVNLHLKGGSTTFDPFKGK